MAHVAKYAKASCGNMCGHYDRSANNISNEKIDHSKTIYNYNLAPERDISQMDYINKRCSEVKCLNRKDVKVMCSWVITAPKELPVDDEKKFFNESYKFLTNRYGGEKNVISAHVHVDETQPHMHFAFVPVVKDKKTGLEKVSAKECLTKTDLSSFHNDLDKHMENIFGRNIGILNQATRDGNKSIEELKRKSAIERLSEVDKITKQKLRDTDKTLKNTSEKLSSIGNDINVLIDTKNVLEKQIDTYNKVLETHDDIDSIGSRNLFGKVSMSVDEANKLKEQAKAYFSVNSKNYSLELHNKNLLSENMMIKKELNKVKQEYKEVSTKYNNITHTLRSNPELVKMYNQQIDINKQRAEQELKMQEKRMQERSKNLNLVKRDDFSR